MARPKPPRPTLDIDTMYGISQVKPTARHRTPRRIIDALRVRYPQLIAEKPTYQQFEATLKQLDPLIDTPRISHLLGRREVSVAEYRRGAKPVKNVIQLMAVQLLFLRAYGSLWDLYELAEKAPIAFERYNRFCQSRSVSRTCRLLGLYASTIPQFDPVNATISRTILIYERHPEMIPEPIDVARFRALIESHLPKGRKLTQELIASLIGLKRPAVSMLLKGDIEPSELVLGLMAMIEAALKRDSFETIEAIVQSAKA